MLSSKANAALTRLKEIEEKYKIKREKQKWNRKEDSSISSVSIIPSENLSAESKKSDSKNVSKLKLDIKIPDTRFEEHVVETKLSSESKKSTSDMTSPEPHRRDIDVDLDVTMPSKDKSPRFVKKQESLISNVTSIQENSSIESVLDDSMISSKSLSRSKTSRRNFSTVSDKPSRREERTKTIAKYNKGKESSDNSSISKQSRLYEKSNEKSFKTLKLRERDLIEEKMIVKIPASFDRNLDHSKSLRDDSVIEESIDTVNDGSEIISELSRANTSITAKTNDSIKSSKYLATENASAIVQNSSKQLATESGYANDTFEDISSSTVRSQSQGEKIIDEKKKINSASSSTKKTDTALLEQYHKINKSNRNEHVIKLVALKSNATEVNLDYINDFESNANSDNVIVRLMKSPKIVNSQSENRYQEHRPESFKANISNAINFDKNISDSLKSLTELSDVTNTNEKKNLPEMTSIQQESSQGEYAKASNKIRERAMINIIGLPAADGKNIIKSSSEENKIEKENVFEESSDQRIFQDADNVLKKLHKDALVKRHASSKNAKKMSEKPFENKTETKDVMKIRKDMPREENKNLRSSEENKMRDRNDRKLSSQKRKKNIKINSKSAQGRSIESRKEDKASKFDKKQMRGLRKRIIELRLQQEREDLQKYLQELENLRLELSSSQSYFSPLKFPKIAGFTQSTVAINLVESKQDQLIVLREKVSAIKRYLKDQYILYRDHCAMAQAINAHYVPTTLQDTKKTIRKLRKMSIKSR